jgi:putative ABC transport system ATP-binding protein
LPKYISGVLRNWIGVYNVSFIKVSGLRKVYRIGNNEKVVALDNIDLEVECGEIICILGTSGSGKSTLLNMLAGLEKPTRGEIIINHKNIAKMNENQLAMFRRSTMGFVFQSYNLMPHLTALENVGFPLMLKNVSRRIREKKAKEMLTLVGLHNQIKRKPSQMSGGQQQRVGIARALVSNPKLIFADEPTGNLDSRTTKEVMELILLKVKENNQTLIIVTHDVNIASYADRIIHIFDGNVAKIEVAENRQQYVQKVD